MTANGAGGDRPDVALAQTFAALARSLLAEGSVQDTLMRICTTAVATLHGCDHAGIAVIQKRRITTHAASDDLPARVDAIQYEVDQGPCLDAIKDHLVFRADDLTEDPRWPQFSKRAAEETGVRSILSFRLFAEEHTMGALSFYSRKVAAFDEDDADVGTIFAAHAAVAIVGARGQEQMAEGIRHRDVIGQAKGILMAREGVDEEKAFEMLMQASQRTNVKLRAIAEQIASQRTSPRVS